MTAQDGWLLALDTGTATIVAAIGTADGQVVASDAIEGRYRHSQELLPAIVRLVGRAEVAMRDLAGVVVGTGPGAFTGLRVGLATAKTLAHELGVSIVGVATSEGLLAAAAAASRGTDAPELWLPSGPRDRVVVRADQAPAIVAGSDADASGQAVQGTVVAVDLDGRAPEAALERGRGAVAGLPAALLRLGAARLAAGDVDDPERLVPRYASAPRGAASDQADGRVAWSHDPR
jgi:tRNA threonylcarbamoyl adenosine modification protein YeaZ